MTSQALAPAIAHPTDDLQKHQRTTKHYYDRTAKELPPLGSGEHVLMRIPEENCWTLATVVAHHDSPRSYLVDNGNNLVRRNRVHLKPNRTREPPVVQGEEDVCLPSHDHPVLDTPLDDTSAVTPPSPPPTPRRSLRVNKGTLPARYKDFDMQ